jgi:hypothetical protein
MGSSEQLLRDELRASHRREEALRRQLNDLLDRIMYLTGKPYAPTPLELSDGPEPQEEKPEDPDYPGYTAHPEEVGL